MAVHANQKLNCMAASSLDSQLWVWSSYHKASVVGHFKTRVQYRVASMCKGLVTAINNVNIKTNKPFLIVLLSVEKLKVKNTIAE